MLEKVKAVFELSQKLTNVQKQVDSITIQLEDMNKQVVEVMSRSEDMIKTRNDVLGDHARLTSEFRAQKDQLRDIIDSLSREVGALKDVKRQLTSEIGSTLSREVKDQITSGVSELKKQAASLLTAKKTLDILNANTSKAQEQVFSLQDAAAQLKTEDSRTKDASATYRNTKYSTGRKTIPIS